MYGLRTVTDDTVTEESIGKVIECIERSKADVIGFSILKVSEANRVSEVESAIWNEHCRFSSNQIVCDKSILPRHCTFQAMKNKHPA